LDFTAAFVTGRVRFSGGRDKEKEKERQKSGAHEKAHLHT